MMIKRSIQSVIIGLILVSAGLAQSEKPDVEAGYYSGDERAGLAPETPVLVQNFPNPFNAQTMIQFYLPQSDQVTLIIFNLKGQVVESVINGNISKGYHEIRVDMSSYSSGVYFYQLKTSKTVLNRKLVYMR